VQLTPLSTQWAPRKKIKKRGTIFFGHGVYRSFVPHISILCRQNESLLYDTNCIMLSNYVIPVITCGLQQQFSLCVASLCFLRRKQDKLFQTTQLFLLINKFLLFPAATCFVFYTKTVFSLNYYYIGHSR